MMKVTLITLKLYWESRSLPRIPTTKPLKLGVSDRNTYYVKVTLTYYSKYTGNNMHACMEGTNNNEDKYHFYNWRTERGFRSRLRVTFQMLKAALIPCLQFFSSPLRFFEPGLLWKWALVAITAPAPYFQYAVLHTTPKGLHPVCLVKNVWRSQTLGKAGGNLSSLPLLSHL